MALRNQPYVPLYVQDFSTDEKLAECSASACGVLIRLMCLMHKQDEYGMILLKQKDKQADKQIENFALKVAKHFPYPFDVTLAGLTELVTEGVLTIDGDYLIQKRMVKDCAISEKRASAGQTGGKATQEFVKAKLEASAKAKSEANPEYVNEIEDVIKTLNEISARDFSPKTESSKKHIRARFNEKFTKEDMVLVITHKTAEWKDDVKWRKFLRPETLFGTKFESYLQDAKASGVLPPSQTRIVKATSWNYDYGRIYYEDGTFQSIPSAEHRGLNEKTTPISKFDKHVPIDAITA